jgi:hypothetical protein
MQLSGTIVLAVFALACAGDIRGATYLDLASFAQLTSWSGSQPHRFVDLHSVGKADNLGLEWDEDRDVREVGHGIRPKCLVLKILWTIPGRASG